MKGTEQHPPMFETTRVFNYGVTGRVSSGEDLDWSPQGFIEIRPITEPQMTLAPANEVQAPKVTTLPEGVFVDARWGKPDEGTPTLPEHRVSVMNRVKRGTTALVETKHGLVAKRIDPLPQPMLNASNASPTLKAKLREICRAELETGTLYQEVADTFALALDSALRSLR